MADIELVIKINEEIYKEAIKSGYLHHLYDEDVATAFIEGTPLPKGHGKLVDVTSIPNEDRDIIVRSLLAPHSIAFIGAITLDEYINNLPTIIEADSEKE